MITINKNYFNRKNIADALKKGISIGLATATIGTFAGCSKQKEETSTNSMSYTQSETIPQTSTDDIGRYDWTNTLSILKEKEEEVYSTFNLVLDDKKHSDNQYGIVICESKDKYNDHYFKVARHDGTFKNNRRYRNLLSVNDNTVILCEEDYSTEHSATYQYTYFLLDLKTGEQKAIKARYLIPIANDYIVKTTYNSKSSHFATNVELLDAKGDIKLEKKDSTYSYDDSTQLLYLSNDIQTEIFDTNNSKIREISGRVISAKNKYIILADQTISSTGVFYMDHFDSLLEVVIEPEYCSISTVTSNNGKPVFDCSKINVDKKTMVHSLINADGKTLLESETYNCFLSTLYGDYIQGIKINNQNEKTYDLLHLDGTLISEDNKEHYICGIPQTDKLIFQLTKDSKFGIKDTSNNIIELPKYDSLYVCPTPDEKSGEIIDWFLVGRIEDENMTVAFRKGLTEIVSGDYDYFKIEELAINTITKEKDSKQLILNK